MFYQSFLEICFDSFVFSSEGLYGQKKKPTQNQETPNKQNHTHRKIASLYGQYRD